MAKRKYPNIGRSKTHAQLGQLPLFAPESEWKPTPPSEWPDLRGSHIIGLDTETDDPHLITDGPGFIRGDAEVIGVSLANDEGASIYLPLKHVDTENHDPDNVAKYLNHVLGGEEDKTGANLQYDAEALWSMGVKWNGSWKDIQVAEPLINEERRDGYSLEALSLEYLGDGKQEDLLREAAAAYSADPKKNMRWIPAKFVAEYAEADALQPIEILEKQQVNIQRENLHNVFNLEVKLQPVLWEMRKKGVRVDVPYLEWASEELKTRIKLKYNELYGILGRDLKYTAATKVGQMLEERGYKDIPSTKYGPSVSNDWLTARSGDRLCELLLDLRIADKMKKDFIDEMLRVHVNGRVHANWLGMVSEDGGTKTGRMASRKINLQQIPGRHPFYGPFIRRAFIPEEGEKFIHHDFKAQEPRIMLEFAHRCRIDEKGLFDPNGRMLTGVKEFMKTYLDNPRTDFHDKTIALIKENANQTLERGPAKDIGLGAMYGMGTATLAERLGTNKGQAKNLLELYFAGVPFLDELIFAIKGTALDRGFVKTASGRRRRFNKFQPTLWEARKRWGFNFTFDDEEEANRETGGDYERAFVHKALNAIVQGTAGDQTKHAIVELYYDHGILMDMAVHDELNKSGHVDEAPTISNVMETVLSRHYGFTVPFVCDSKLLNNWGEAK